MRKDHQSGLPVELWRDVNRAAYARSQATFADVRARLVSEALALLRGGADLAAVRAYLDAKERGQP